MLFQTKTQNVVQTVLQPVACLVLRPLSRADRWAHLPATLKRFQASSPWGEGRPAARPSRGRAANKSLPTVETLSCKSGFPATSNVGLRGREDRKEDMIDGFCFIFANQMRKRKSGGHPLRQRHSRTDLPGIAGGLPSADKRPMKSRRSSFDPCWNAVHRSDPACL